MMNFSTADLFASTLEDEFQSTANINLSSPSYTSFLNSYPELSNPASLVKDIEVEDHIPITESLPVPSNSLSDNQPSTAPAPSPPPPPPLINSQAPVTDTNVCETQATPANGAIVTPINIVPTGAVPVMVNGLTGQQVANVSVVPSGTIPIVGSNGSFLVCGNSSNIPILQLGTIQLTQEDLNQVHQQLQAKFASQAGPKQNAVLYAGNVCTQPVVQAAECVIVNGTTGQPPVLQAAGTAPKLIQISTLPAAPAVQTIIANPQPISVPAPKLQLGNATSNQTTDENGDEDSINIDNPEAPPMTMHIKQSNELELKDLEDLEKFAKKFKERRVELGFTQGDVGAAIGRSAVNDFSQTTISRFEAMNLSLKNMIKLRPLLEKWLEHHEQRETCLTATTLFGEPPMSPGQSGRKRKRRTTIDNSAREILEKKFVINKKPNVTELQVIADQLDLERGVVRVWFCNRRQKEKRHHYYTAINVQSISS